MGFRYWLNTALGVLAIIAVTGFLLWLVTRA